MNVAELTVPWHEARKKYAEYAMAVKEGSGEPAYEAIKKAYRELSLDRRVIDLAASMRRAGLDPQGRPKLAVVRADAKRWWFNHSLRYNDPTPTFAAVNDFYPKRRSSNHVSFAADVFGATVTKNRLRAIVPMIPPSLLPVGKLHRYFILWEADWEQAPIDPMLLRPLGCNLYVVLATWDLTPVERAVLGGAMQPS